MLSFQKAPKPYYLAAVDHLLRNIPADSRRTFIRAFQVQELAASTAFSMSNVCQGAIAAGAIKNGSGDGPSYERMLSNCPPIKEFCAADITRMPMLINKCRIIAAEMVVDRTRNSSNYLGTPDDQRMFALFGEFFGPIFIGTGDVSSGDRVTDLELIRWRTTLLGANGQLEKENKKRLVASEKTAASLARTATEARLAVSQAAALDLVVDLNGTTTSVAPGNVGEVVGAVAPARKGKKCSNINCPDHAHYYAGTCKLLWSKCAKGCLKCEEGKGGSIHVCPNSKCKSVLEAHMAH